MARRKAKSKQHETVLAQLQLAGFETSDHMVDIIAQLDTAKRGYRLGVSGPRQIFKTEIGLAWLTLGAINGEDGVYFAHEDDLRKQAFERASAICEPLKKKGIVKRIDANVGQWLIRFESGAVLRFRVRGSKSKVGLTKISRIVFDEAQVLDEQFFNDLVPTMAFGESDKALLIGNPPSRENVRLFPNNKFVSFRKAAKGSERWIEFSASDGFTNKDLTLAQANAARKRANPAWRFIPGFGDNTSELLLDLGLEAFSQIYLGEWLDFEVGDLQPPELKPRQVSKALTTRGSESKRFAASVGITADSTSAYVCLSDGATLEIADEFEFDISGGDLDQIVEWIRKHSAIISKVTLPRNVRGQALNSTLIEQRWSPKRVALCTLPETSNRFARFLRAINSGDAKVFETNAAKVALSTFWKGYDAKSSGVVIRATDPNVEAFVLALALAVPASADAVDTTGGGSLGVFYGRGTDTPKTAEKPPVGQTEPSNATKQPRSAMSVFYGR